VFPTPYLSPAKWPTRPASISLPTQPLKQCAKTKHLLINRLHRFTGPISQACDHYVHYLLTEPTHHSLTNIGGVYNLQSVDFPHDSPRPFQLMVLRFPLMILPSLRLTIQPLPTKLKRSNPNLVSATPPLDFYHILSSKHSSD
jgi:hypothetical protein